MKKNKASDFRFRAVLLIDDNELDNFINQKVIEAHLFAKTIYTASNGRSAIDLIKNLALLDAENFPELFFVDLNMPIMDGFQFIEYCLSDLSVKNRKIMIVVLTSSVNAEDEKRIKALSPDIQFLHKPLTPKMLEKISR